MPSIKIIAGIVVYSPFLDTLLKTIDSLSSQCDKIVLFLNSPFAHIEYILSINPDKVEIVDYTSNKGLGFAHGKLIELSIGWKAKYLIISDQDSIYPKNFSDSMTKLSFYNFTIACPAWKNSNSDFEENAGQYFLKGAKLFFTKSKFEGYLAHGISSGMFVNLDKLDPNILPDEDLFIDWVDNDWCWRLVSAGHKIIYNSEVTLNHQLGVSQSNILKNSFTKRAPIRDYYIIRNIIFLLLYRNYKVDAKKYLIIKLGQHLVFSFFTGFSEFFTRLKYLFFAFYHGITKKMGAFPSAK